jgi:hypothetical protein
MLQTAHPTPRITPLLPELYKRVERHIPPFEWSILADDIAAILARRSVMLHMRISRSGLSSRCHRAAYLTAIDSSRLVATHRMRLDRGPSPAQH